MPDSADTPETPVEAPAAAPAAAVDPDAGLDPILRVRKSWRRLWQVPALIGAGGVLVLGIGVAIATRPTPAFAPALDRAEVLLKRNEPRAAISLLNERVYPWLEKPGAVSPIDTRRYHLLIARAVYDGQQKFKLTNDENRLTVIRSFQEAERQGVTLSADDLHALADTYAERGEIDLALARAHAIPGDSGGLKDEIYKDVIDDWLGSAVPRHDRALELLTEMLSDADLPIADRVWAMARRAQVQIDQGFADEAITRLLRAMPRLDETEPELLARLHAQLGRAYLSTGALREAQAQFDRVLQLAHGDPGLRAAALLNLARVHSARNETVEARDLFTMVVERYPEVDSFLPALLGLGEAEAMLHATPASIDAYTRLVDAMEDKPEHAEPLSGTVRDSLLRQHLDQMTLREFDTALEYASLAGSLYERADRPAVVIQALANGHKAVAETTLGVFSDEPLKDLARLDPSARAEAQRNLMRSAALYRLHADKFVLTDNNQYGRSLWESADLFDRAGDQAAAVEAFNAYAVNNPSGARHGESRYRLARAHQAMGSFDQAGTWFEDLIEEHRDGRTVDVGPLAVRSYVPLAQCYLSDEDADNDAEAEQLLMAATDGSLGQTGALQFHEALVELGKRFYDTGRFERAIERFDEALQRYPDDPEIEALRYLHADANRKLADKIADSLREPMPDSERRLRQSRIKQHRRAAMGGFDKVHTALGKRNEHTLTQLDRQYLRNSSFYLGDCAFDLGEFDTAVRYYDAARNRYSADPSSLVAMTQIVHAHLEQGDIGRARTAHERARQFYLSLPEEVWDDPTLPMGRKDWQRWLESSATLYQVAEGKQP